jgi:hypothetical protein
MKVRFFLQVAFPAGVFGQGVRMPVMKEENARHLKTIGRSGELNMDKIGPLLLLIRIRVQGPHQTENYHQRQQQGFSYPGQAEVRHHPHPKKRQKS